MSTPPRHPGPRPSPPPEGDPRRHARIRAGLLTALFGVLFALGLALGVHADEHDLPGTLGVFGPGRLHGAVYPREDIPLRFSHAQHLTRGLRCDRCHGDVSRSDRSADNNLPRGVACDACHGQQHPRPADAPANCTMCHTRAEGSRVTHTTQLRRPNLHFSHAKHAARGATCEGCHGDMSKVRLATNLQLPAEATCLTCHDGQKASSRCAECHPADAQGRLVIRDFADRAAPMLVPRGAASWGAAHDLGFVEDHRGIAKANPSLCANCHNESFCADCHAGPVRPLRIHAGDYMTTHALDARARTQDCQACHRLQTECLACHERVGLGSGVDRQTGVGSSLQFHPPGFAGPPGAPQGHAFAAQRNLAACVSCHTEDSCLACHATTGVARPGLNVSPHGPGFATSARCQALAARNHRVCLKCHEPGDPRHECL